MNPESNHTSDASLVDLVLCSVAPELPADEHAPKTCAICFNTSSEDPTMEFVQSSTLHAATGGQCGGGASFFCQSCLKTYLAAKVAERQAEIRCPLCTELVQDSVFEALLEAEDLAKRRDTMASWTELQTARDRRLAGRYSTVDVVRRIQLLAWQAGRDVRPCPGCHHLIQKNGGCNHMTCAVCRSEFFWCCLQAYRGKHHQALCLAGQYNWHPSKYWGPILPVRVVTKAISLPPLLAAGVIGVGVLGLVKGPAPWVRRYQAWRRTRRDRFARERFQRAVLARAQEADRTLKQRLRAALAHATGVPPQAFHDVTLQRVANARFTEAQPCPLGCHTPAEISPRFWLEHLLDLHEPPTDLTDAEGAEDAAPQPTPMPEGGIVSVAQLQGLMRGGCFDFGLPTAVGNPLPGAAAAVAPFPDWWDELEAPPCSQMCLCGQEFSPGADTLVQWCQHLREMNPARLAATMAEPGLCNVRERPGFLCSCSGFVPSMVDPDLCECLHPRMLH